MLKRLFTIPVSDVYTHRRGQIVLSIAYVLIFVMFLAAIPTALRPNSLISAITLGIGLLIGFMTIRMVNFGHINAAAWAIVLLSVGLVSLPLFLRPDFRNSLIFYSFSIVIAGLVLRPWHVWPVTGLCLFGIALKGWLVRDQVRASQVVSDILVNAILLIIILGIVSYLGARIMAQAFQETLRLLKLSEDNARQIDQLNKSLEDRVMAQTADLRQALSEVQIRANEKQSLLDEIEHQRSTIREMSVPVLPVSDKTLVMPLIGNLDSSRLDETQSQALAAIERTGAHTLLLDITGVPVVDTFVAQGLLRTVQAARLLGARPMLIGVRPEVAQSLVALGVNLDDLRTASNLESALRHRAH